MSKVRLGDYVRIKTGKLDANAASPDGDYPFFTCAVEPLKIDKYSYDCECVLVAGNGDLNVKYYNGKFDAYQRTYIIESIDKTHLCVPYLYRFMDNYIDTLRSQSIGGVIKYIKLGNLTEAPIFVPSIETQNKTVKLLSFLDSLIEKAYQQNKKLDELVKSRFLEMFGDPVLNIQKWIKVPMGNYMSLLTDFSANGSYEYLDSNVVMYSEPNYALMVRTTDLERNDFNNDVKYIDEKAYNILSKSKLFGNEIIMNKIGSAGKVYLMPKLNRPASLGRNAFMFRFNSDINILFLYYLLTSEYGLSEIQQHVRGAVTKTITKDAVRSIRIIVPPIELQNQFADFVTKVERQKVIVQQSIDKLETLKKSLMQEYFG